MSDEWKESYIKSLNLNDIDDPIISKEVEIIIRKYLEEAEMTEAFRKIPTITELIKWLRKTSLRPSVLEAIEHVQGKLEERKKFGPPSLLQLFEYAPKESEYRIPPVFYEHPQLRRVRILSLAKGKVKDEIQESKILDVNQLKIHYVIGNLDRKFIGKEETLAKVLCGPVRYDWEKKCRYVVLNDVNSQYPHEFDAREVDGSLYLSPNFITIRALPAEIIPEGGVYFCPSCYNLFDNDEISEHNLREVNSRIQKKIQGLQIEDINKNWIFCPFCSTRALRSRDPDEVKEALLFSCLYRSNLYPDIAPLLDRSVQVEKTSGNKVINQDQSLVPLLGNPIYSEKGGIGERIKGFTRIMDIHPDDRNRPNWGIYRWKRWNLKKGDKNIYYRYESGGKEFPAQICSEIENTDALVFSITDPGDILSALGPAILTDLIFSSFRLLLDEKFPETNTFALDESCEAILSYYLLSQGMRIPKKSEDLLDTIPKCLNQLRNEISALADVCREQEIDFKSDALPSLRELIGKIPLNLKELSGKFTIKLGGKPVTVSRKLAVILHLFGVGEKWGNLFIFSKKSRPGLDFITILDQLEGKTKDSVQFRRFVQDSANEIYFHTLAHLIYRASIEVSKCDEKDISYDYDSQGEIIIYDNYSGGAGFVKECVECFDNLLEDAKVRPSTGLVQQIEANSGICPNYFVNYLLYEGISSLNLEELKSSADSDLHRIAEQIMLKYSITDSTHNRILSKIYGQGVLPSLLSLLKQKYQIVYSLLKNKFELAYDDLVLVQQCPTIFLFALLCQLNDFEIAVLMRSIFREEVPQNLSPEKVTLLARKWKEVFSYAQGSLFSRFRSKYLPIFEDVISSCTKGCYDCCHILFGCKHPVLEQRFRLNTYLTRLVFSKIRASRSFEFPHSSAALSSSVEKAREEEAVYFYFFLRDFSKIEKFFNTFLSKCLTYDMEQCRPLFLFEMKNGSVKIFVKLRRRMTD